MKLLRSHLSLIATLWWASASICAFAGTVESFFEKFSGLKVNTQNTGQLGELVAMADLKESYPETTHEMLNGIKYFRGSEVVGELDIVIIDKSSQKVVEVVEVKTSKDPSSVYSKASKQLERFVSEFQAPEINLTLEGTLIDKALFSVPFKTRVMGPKPNNPVNRDYDLHFSINHSELEDLLMKLSLHSCEKAAS